MIVRYSVLTILCISLLLQNALAIGLAAFSMQQARANVSGDIELICTGKGMRYISVSQTELKGEFVFISLDSLNTPNTLKEPLDSHFLSDSTSTHYIDCTNSTLADLPVGNDSFYTVTVDAIYARYQALKARLDQQSYTAFAYAAPLSRAPPTS